MPASRLVAIEDRLLAVEREICLLDRATPCNFWAEVERLGAATGSPGDAPRFRYTTPTPNVDALERELGDLVGALRAAFGTSDDVRTVGRKRVVARLLEERAEELVLECRLVGARGDDVRELARQRFLVDEALLDEAHDLAEEWFAEGALGDAASGSGGSSDAEVALATEVRRLALEAKLPIAVEERPIATLAAVTESSLVVRSGARATPGEALRVFVHEVTAHLLPRLRATSEGPPYRVGTPGADADEEGRAILAEERARVLGPGRKRQLGLRHLAAEYVRRGVPFAEASAAITRRGVSQREAGEVLGRALRGGGLAREIVYLPGYLRVKRALAAEPLLERELERGRVSIAAARRLSEVFD